MKIIEWCVVDADDTLQLMTQVRILLANNWQPRGDVRMVIEAPGRRIWFQVMVKYEPRQPGNRTMTL